jgi:hypothetical protein
LSRLGIVPKPSVRRELIQLGALHFQSIEVKDDLATPGGVPPASRIFLKTLPSLPLGAPV